MDNNSPVSTPLADRPRSRPWWVITGLAAMAGLLAVMGLLSIPAAATPNQHDISVTHPVASDYAVSMPDIDALTDKARTRPDTTTPALPPVIADNGKDAEDPTTNQCVACDLPQIPCDVCDPPQLPCDICGNQTTTTTPPTTTTPITTTTPADTTTTEPLVVAPVANNASPDAPEAPEALAHTGTNTTLIPLLAVGVLLVAMGGLLFGIARTRSIRAR